MKRVKLYARVRHAVMIDGLSQREAARRFGIDPRTVKKMLSYSVPPGYVRTRPPVRPKLDPFIGVIDRIVEEDRERPKKQRHTSKRIFERLRDEHGFTGGITIVKDYICGARQRQREMFVPLTHPPGHAQVDFGEALAVIGGMERKIHVLTMSLGRLLCEGWSEGNRGSLLRRPCRGVRLLRQRAAFYLLKSCEIGFCTKCSAKSSRIDSGHGMPSD